MVGADGTYSGTLTLAGAKPATMPVVGFAGATGMSLVSSGAHALSVLARPATETISNGAANGATTTAGNEYRGTLVSADGLSGFVTVYDTSVLREYSFAAHITGGPHSGADLNGSLFLFSDGADELHGYFVRDADGAMFPLLSGVLTSRQMLLHIDLSGADIMGATSSPNAQQIIGVATASTTLIPNQVAYKGTLTGPSAADRGTWLSLPPE
jgi:hypothetical protein